MRVWALALLVCLAAGCAGHRSPDSGNPFVTRSQTTYHDGATFDAPKGSSVAKASEPAAPPAPPPVPPPSPAAPAASPTLEASDAALAAKLAAVRTHPTADNFVALANLYYRLGIFDLATTNFRHALKVRSTFAPAEEGLARVWRDWGLPQLGLPFAYRAVASDPHSPTAENTLGTILFALGNPESAQSHFERALVLSPASAYALNNLCYVAFMLGNVGPAVERCHEALALDPSLTAVHNNLGLIYAAEGRPGDAGLEFTKAQSGPAAAYNLGLVHMARHEYQDAVGPFETACRATPEVEGACAWMKEARKMASGSRD